MSKIVRQRPDERERTIRRPSSDLQAESLTEALVIAVKALGGSKAVGPHLWPELAPEAAQRRLLDALNDDRPQYLAPDHVLLVMRLARARGCHAVMQYLAGVLSYAEPVPVEPRDEADELRRQFIESTRALAKMAQRIEQLERPGPRAVA